MVQVELANQVFGRLTAIQTSGVDKRGEKLWMCRCECGNIVNVLSSNLRNGHTKSCGCLKKESKGNLKHGMYGTSTHKIWASMMQRCNNPNNTYYYCYGGRGIAVCERWHKFENFLEDMGERPEGLTLERIDNNDGYYKDNCRWASPKEQARNRINSVDITYDGRTQCIAAWEEELGFKHGTLWMRVNKYGWSVDRAIETPVGNFSREPITVFGKTQSLTQHAKDHELGLTTVQARIASGMSIEDALTTPRKIVAGVRKGR